MVYDMEYDMVYVMARFIKGHYFCFQIWLIIAFHYTCQLVSLNILIFLANYTLIIGFCVVSRTAY